MRPGRRSSTRSRPGWPPAAPTSSSAGYSRRRPSPCSRRTPARSSPPRTTRPSTTASSSSAAAGSSRTPRRRRSRHCSTTDASGVGEVREVTRLAAAYVELVCERFGAPLEGLNVVLDCANGAMTEVAPRGLRAAGRVRHGGRERARRHEHQRTAAAPPTSACSRGSCPSVGADLGVAFDGDGDRMLAVDAAGNEVDGDQIVAVLALHLGVDLVAVTADDEPRLPPAHGRARHPRRHHRRRRPLRARGSSRRGRRARRRAVRARPLPRRPRQRGRPGRRRCCSAGRSWSRGARSPTWPPSAALSAGEGERAGARARSSRRASATRSRGSKPSWTGRGRVLVRPSGTEPVVRVLAEAETEEEARRLCASIGCSRAERARLDAQPGSCFWSRFSGTDRLRGSVEQRESGRDPGEDGRGVFECAGSSDTSGPRTARPLLLQGLERLEYRGYDSAGLCLVEDEGLDYVRAVGNLDQLKEAARAQRLAVARPASGTRAGRRTAGSASRTPIR